MFEKNDPTIDLERYKRIIFEWCSGVNGILHVDLDRSEGWLYVKCKDKESAGQGKSTVFILWKLTNYLSFCSYKCSMVQS